MTQRIDCHFVAAGKFHDIDFARLEILKLLAEVPEIRTTVACDYSDVARLDQCAFLITYVCDLLPRPEETKAIRAFLERGGRWFALHGTNSILRFVDGLVDTPDERPDLMEILGTQFKAHPVIGAPFTVEVVDKDHPLNEGLSDFDTIDEQYLSTTVAPIHVLMQTRFSGEATGFVDLNWEDSVHPVVYLRDVGNGAVLYNTLGHCRGHYDLPEMLPYYPHPERCSWNYPIYFELLRRGINWAMEKGNPTT
jgi:uncharacterized protein